MISSSDAIFERYSGMWFDGKFMIGVEGMEGFLKKFKEIVSIMDSKCNGIWVMSLLMKYWTMVSTRD